MGAAQTQAPTSTNYDVGSTTWADLKQAPLPSAMKVANLGHGISWLPIDPVQVSIVLIARPHHFIPTIFLSYYLQPMWERPLKF